jgi:capsular exopolysaccharide synthesis family protein
MASRPTYLDAVAFLSMRLCSPYSKEQQTILVTSAQPGEGKTTLTWDLARAFARRGVSVALVDADMRMSRSRSRTGLADLLSGTAQIEDVAHSVDGVTFIPVGLRPRAPSSLIASDAMPRLLNRLQSAHNVVIVDTPPAPVGGDVWALSKLVQRVLLVVKHSQTSRQQIENALRAIDKGGTELAVVLNMVRATPGDADDMFSPSMLKYYAFEPRPGSR